MFVEILLLSVVSLQSIESKVILDIADEELLHISNEIHSFDKEYHAKNTTAKTVKQIVEANLNDSKISDDKNKTKLVGHNTDDTVNLVEPDSNGTSQFPSFDSNIIDIDEKESENGSALILTPYIENGKLTEARDLCEVKSDIFLGVKSYSGFLTVNKTYNSNLFFWYFPIENRTVGESPWIIWLQGGPGASSLSGLFEEIGPFSVPKRFPLKRNPYSWLRDHSLVFIDNPVGSGFSFTDHKDGFVKDMATYALHLKLAVVQLLELFPELKTAPLYVAGESYGGKYAPALAMELHKLKKTGSEINLQGVITGNGFVEASMVTQISRSFYHFGLISKEDTDSIQPLIDAFADDVTNNRSFAAKEKWGTLVFLLLLMSGQTQGYNFLRDDIKYGQYTWPLDLSEVKRAIHVGDIKFSPVNFTVNNEIAGEFLTSARPLYEELLNHYKVLAYCGQLDQLIPCFLGSEQYRKWQWNKTKEFLKGVRRPYIFKNRLAGYHKSGGNLTEVQIRGAGHMAPMDNPAPVQNLVSRWTHGQPLSLMIPFVKPTELLDLYNSTINVLL